MKDRQGFTFEILKQTKTRDFKRTVRLCKFEVKNFLFLPMNRHILECRHSYTISKEFRWFSLKLVKVNGFVRTSRNQDEYNGYIKGDNMPF